MAWRISYWNTKGTLTVVDGFASEQGAMLQGSRDMAANLVDARGNFGIIVDEYEPETVTIEGELG